MVGSSNTGSKIGGGYSFADQTPPHKNPVKVCLFSNYYFLVTQGAFTWLSRNCELTPGFFTCIGFPPQAIHKKKQNSGSNLPTSHLMSNIPGNIDDVKSKIYTGILTTISRLGWYVSGVVSVLAQVTIWRSRIPQSSSWSWLDYILTAKISGSWWEQNLCTC